MVVMLLDCLLLVICMFFFECFYNVVIDGLCVLVVLVVILFYINVVWLFGGFIGVDLFFVVFGFVIS